MVKIRVASGRMAMNIYKVRQDILGLERCQEIDGGPPSDGQAGMTIHVGCLRLGKISHSEAASFRVRLAINV